MSNENIKQIEEFSEFWHLIMKKSDFSKIEEQFPRLKGLTATQISIISIVSKNPDVILREIGTSLDIPKSTLANAIDRLENRKYINRIISKRDRSSYGLELTGEGHLANQEKNDFEYKVYGPLLNALDTDEEKKELLRLLRKIIENIES